MQLFAITENENTIITKNGRSNDWLLEICCHQHFTFHDVFCQHFFTLQDFYNEYCGQDKSLVDVGEYFKNKSSFCKYPLRCTYFSSDVYIL